MYEATYATTVAESSPEVRASFLRRTYMHLTGAVFLFVLLEAILLQTPLAPAMVSAIQGSKWIWLAMLGGFMLVGHFAHQWALDQSASVAKQYAGLGVYIVLEAILFMPMLFIAATYMSPSVIPEAALTTLVLFGGLTGVVFLTGKDFTFMRGILGLLAMGAMAAIVCSIIFGLSLGTWFSLAMVGLACGYILYHTSAIMQYYHPNQHVAASLALFADVALLFWYVLRIFMSRD